MKNTKTNPMVKHYGHGVTEVTITLNIAQATILGQLYNRMKNTDYPRSFLDCMPLLALFEEFAPHNVWQNIDQFLEKTKIDQQKGKVIDKIELKPKKEVHGED